MKRFVLALALCLSAIPAHAAQLCTRSPVMCDNNYVTQPSTVVIAAANPASTCSARYITVTVNTTDTKITYGTNWCATGNSFGTCTSQKVNTCMSLANEISKIDGVKNAYCTASSYTVTINPQPESVRYFHVATSLVGCATVTNPNSGGTLQVGQALFTEGGLGALTVTSLDGKTAGKITVNKMAYDGTIVDFTSAHEPAIFAKTTGAIKTAANAQQDFFYVGYPGKYFEVAQGVGSLGANTLFAANGFAPSATGFVLTMDATATDSLEITEGIVAGAAHSYLTGTDSATCQAVFYIPTRTALTHLGFGLRKLAAYETASTAAEWLAAYDDKAMIGVIAAGAMRTYTSVGGTDTSTTLAHAAAANSDMLALEVDMTAGRAVTYKIGTSTPAGTTYAQFQTALTTAIASLAADANAVAYSFTTSLTVVPSIIIGASGTGTPDATLVYYSCTK